MDIVISSDDQFTYTTPIFLLTALAGQTVSYGTGSDNGQTVTNGFDLNAGTGEPPLSSLSMDAPEALELPPFSTDFVAEIFKAIDIDNPDLIDLATDVFGSEAERLLHEIFNDESAIQSGLGALDEIFGGAPLGSVSGLVDQKLNDDDSANIVPVLTLIRRISDDVDTDSGLSIVIDAGDSFDFVVGATSVTKLLGQTVSYVSGENNQQTVVNGFDDQQAADLAAAGALNAPVAGSRDQIDETGTPDGDPTSETRNGVVAPAANTARTEAAEDADDDGFSIVIDTGDDFAFTVGDVDIVKMFGQTVSYTTGTSNVQTVTNGPVVTTATSENLPAAQTEGPSDPETFDTDTDTETEVDLPNILISTGDSFYFDVGDTSVTKMFGQTVSFLSGTNNTQTVTNGFVEEADQDSTALGVGALLNDDGASDGQLAAQDVDQDGDDGNEVDVLTLIADIIGDLEDPSAISIIIETGDNFYFDVGDTSITKMFGQTVSYLTGEDNTQTITNGFEATTDDEDNQSPATAYGLSAINLGDPVLNDLVAAEFEAEAEQLLADIASDDGVVTEVIGALDEVFAEAGLFGSVSGLIDDSLTDDGSDDVVAILELLDQIYDDFDTGPDLSIVIDSGDSFEFNVGTTTVTKMFGQTVSYATGEDLTQTVTNGFQADGDVPAVAVDNNDETPAQATVATPAAADLPAAAVPESTAEDDDRGGSQQEAGTRFGGWPRLERCGWPWQDDDDDPDDEEPDDEEPDDDADEPGNGFSVVIDSSNDVIFNVGDVDLVKMFGQTVSYVNGTNNQQTIGNGFIEINNQSLGDDDNASQPAGESGIPQDTMPTEAAQAAADVATSDGDDDQPTIFIDSGDNFVFNVGDVEIVKMFGQTVSYASGEDTTQTVTNGFVAEETGMFEEPSADDEGLASLFDPGLLAGDAGLGSDAGDETDDLLDILALVADIAGDRADGSDLSISIDAADDFTFNVGETDVVKMFGQTVSYVDGDDITQQIVNGPVIETDDVWIS